MASASQQKYLNSKCHKEYNRTRLQKPNRMLYCPSARQDLRRGREIMHGAVQQILAYSVNQTYNLLAIEADDGGRGRGCGGVV